jgi:hypothetical protein
MKRDAHHQSLPFITFRALSKGAPPPCSFNRAPIDRDALFLEPSFNYLSEFPVNETPVILNRAPVEKGVHFQRFHKAPVHELLAKFSSKAPMDSGVRPLALLPMFFQIPRKEPPNRAPVKRDAPFPEPSNYLLKFPVNRLPRFPNRLL